jgi:hypothetical protein
LERSNFTLQSPAAIGLVWLRSRDFHGAVPGAKLRYATGICGTPLWIYFLGNSTLQCNISAVVALA